MPNNPIEKDLLKQAVLELAQEGGFEVSLPDVLIADGIRRCRDDVRDQIDIAMQNGGFPKDRVQAMMDEQVGSYKAELKARMEAMIGERQILRTSLIKADNVKVDTGLQHRQFGDLLVCVQSGLNTYIAGPAGSGKTTAAQQVAQALDLPFYFTGAINSEFKLTGFIDANGRVVCPAFRKAYETGGVFLFDEIDGSMAQAVLAFNAAIANNMMDFPDKTIKKHKDFYCIAAANTYGQGANRIYVGRNQLDGATIDRFVFLAWEYDEELEKILAGNNEWVAHVQNVRKAVWDHKLPFVVSPRASVNGAKLLANKVSRKNVEAWVLYKGLDEESIRKVKHSVASMQPAPAPVLTPETEAEKNARIEEAMNKVRSF